MVRGASACVTGMAEVKAAGGGRGGREGLGRPRGRSVLEAEPVGARRHHKPLYLPCRQARPHGHAFCLESSSGTALHPVPPCPLSLVQKTPPDAS